RLPKCPSNLTDFCLKSCAKFSRSEPGSRSSHSPDPKPAVMSKEAAASVRKVKASFVPTAATPLAHRRGAAFVRAPLQPCRPPTPKPESRSDDWQSHDTQLQSRSDNWQ